MQKLVLLTPRAAKYRCEKKKLNVCFCSNNFTLLQRLKGNSFEETILNINNNYTSVKLRNKKAGWLKIFEFDNKSRKQFLISSKQYSFISQNSLFKRVIVYFFFRIRVMAWFFFTINEKYLYKFVFFWPLNFLMIVLELIR
jgi:hypothetical protein